MSNYTEEFKVKVIQEYFNLFLKNGIIQTHGEIAKRYDISELLLFDWIKHYGINIMENLDYMQENNKKIKSLINENNVLKRILIEKELKIEELTRFRNTSHSKP